MPLGRSIIWLLVSVWLMSAECEGSVNVRACRESVHKFLFSSRGLMTALV